MSAAPIRLVDCGWGNWQWRCRRCGKAAHYCGSCGLGWHDKPWAYTRDLALAHLDTGCSIVDASSLSSHFERTTGRHPGVRR